MYYVIVIFEKLSYIFIPKMSTAVSGWNINKAKSEQQLIDPPPYVVVGIYIMCPPQTLLEFNIYTVFHPPPLPFYSHWDGGGASARILYLTKSLDVFILSPFIV